MKKLIIFASGIVLLSACSDAPKADHAEATAAQETPATTTAQNYKADVAQTTIEWVGTKPAGKHHGVLKITDGSLAVKDGKVEGGKFTIDINSLQPQDQDAEGNGKLQGHLKSPDFFDASKFPTAEFEITSVSDVINDTSKLIMKDATHMITGNLKLKEVTKSITFPAKITMNDPQVLADAEFNIDRTQWGLNYGNDKSLGNKFIQPEVNVKLHLQAAK